MPKVLFGLSDALSLGSKSSTLLVGHIETGWFFVDPVKHNWNTNTYRLIGGKAEIETLGTVDLKFTVNDANGNSETLISKVDMKSTGLQEANTKVCGILEKMN